MPHLQPPDVTILSQIADFFNGQSRINWSEGYRQVRGLRKLRSSLTEQEALSRARERPYPTANKHFP